MKANQLGNQFSAVQINSLYNITERVAARFADLKTSFHVIKELHGKGRCAIGNRQDSAFKEFIGFIGAIAQIRGTSRPYLDHAKSSPVSNMVFSRLRTIYGLL
jgi:hypothetical protein